MEWEHDEDIDTDVLFINKAARIAYETFIGVFPGEGQTTSIVWIALVDAWMNFVIEDMSPRLKGVCIGGTEPHVLKAWYNAPLPVATANLQAGFLTSLRLALSTEKQMLLQLDSELQVPTEIYLHLYWTTKGRS